MAGNFRKLQGPYSPGDAHAFITPPPAGGFRRSDRRQSRGRHRVGAVGGIGLAPWAASGWRRGRHRVGAVGGIGLAPGTDVGSGLSDRGCRIGASYRGFVPGLRTGVSYRGRGVMTAAVARAAEWVFANTPIIRIFAAAYVSNPASQRVLDKAGFRFVGTMHRAFVGNGAFVDGCYYELLK
ncbi:GNAT family N-acetyltransferase [Alistipes sp. HGB5]|uniref:GNAT family N-acetyltransferase n=1 Tax=Alistipes sp. HGB5 TaxID=908612 RepID=UPI001584EBC6|nr:GNAT family protein [Alistipes sp. HGB5]